MEIENIIIEREDRQIYCGVLTYRHQHEAQLLTWSFQWGEAQKVILMLYPSCTAAADASLIQLYYRELADAILEEVFRRV